MIEHGTPVRNQTAIFSKLARDFMRTPAIAVTGGTSCLDALTKMTESDRTAVTVVDSDFRPIGIVTERDITRRMTFRVPPEAPVDDLMSRPVLAIEEDEYLYHAIAHMRRRKIRHMPVVDAEGRLVGILDIADAVAVAAGRLIGQIDQLTQENTVDGLRETKAVQITLAEELLADNLPAVEVQALLTRLNNDIYRRIVDASLAAMAEEGWGKPPVKFSAIVMGSGGRGENYLFPDQDNGFILAPYPDKDHTQIDAFFIELAERMTRDLDAVGFPYCNGYCMAVNPLWRKTLPQWIDQLSLWGRKHNFVAIRLADIFFDFQPVWGERRLAGELRNRVTDYLKTNHFFLQDMYHEEKDHNVALGWFGGLQVEKDNKEHKGTVNLKHTGIIPLIEAVRLLALREGVPQTSTLGRLDALHDLGVLDSDEHENLAEAFRVLTDLLLRRQIRSYRAGRKVGYHINPKKLRKKKYEGVIESLKVIDDLRKRIRTEFTADIF